MHPKQTQTARQDCRVPGVQVQVLKASAQLHSAFRVKSIRVWAPSTNTQSAMPAPDASSTLLGGWGGTDDKCQCPAHGLGTGGSEPKTYMS